jgi:hypothetical protein
MMLIVLSDNEDLEPAIIAVLTRDPVRVEHLYASCLLACARHRTKYRLSVVRAKPQHWSCHNRSPLACVLKPGGDTVHGHQQDLFEPPPLVLIN